MSAEPIYVRGFGAEVSAHFAAPKVGTILAPKPLRSKYSLTKKAPVK